MLNSAYPNQAVSTETISTYSEQFILDSMALEIAIYSATDLHIACESRSKDEVLLCLKKGSQPNEPREVDGNTPLHLASLRGDWDIVELLLDYNSDPNKKNYDGNTSLHVIKKPQTLPVKTFRKFLEKQADCLLSNRESTPFIQMVYDASWSFTGSLTNSPLQQITSINQETRLLKQFIQYHTHFYEHDVSDFLYAALKEQAWDIMRYFLKSAKPYPSGLYIPDHLWCMVLTQKKSHLLHHLLAISHTPDTTLDKLGYTLLHQAVQIRHRGCIKVLLLWGADLSLKNHRGITALQLADVHITHYIQSIEEYIQEKKCITALKTEMKHCNG